MATRLPQGMCLETGNKTKKQEKASREQNKNVFVGEWIGKSK